MSLASPNAVTFRRGMRATRADERVSNPSMPYPSRRQILTTGLSLAGGGLATGGLVATGGVAIAGAAGLCTRS